MRQQQQQQKDLWFVKEIGEVIDGNSQSKHEKPLTADQDSCD